VPSPKELEYPITRFFVSSSESAKAAITLIDGVSFGFLCFHLVER
jgi:hypothetical protein